MQDGHHLSNIEGVIWAGLPVVKVLLAERILLLALSDGCIVIERRLDLVFAEVHFFCETFEAFNVLHETSSSVVLCVKKHP